MVDIMNEIPMITALTLNIDKNCNKASDDMSDKNRRTRNQKKKKTDTHIANFDTFPMIKKTIDVTALRVPLNIRI